MIERFNGVIEVPLQRNYIRGPLDHLWSEGLTPL